MWRTALLVADLDAAYAELGRLGIATISPPTAMAMGPGLPELRFLCFAGPDGEVLELIEQPPNPVRPNSIPRAGPACTR